MVKPPFCPYRACDYHKHPPKTRWWHRIGFHPTRCFGPIPRFRCLCCHRSFSTQTFSTNYYAKRRIDYFRLETLLSSSMSIRSLARSFDCSCGSVLNRIDRLARQALAAHARLRPEARRYEGVCIDGLVSFDRSQYFPNDITISIATDSRYVLAFTHATRRRSGAMTASQKMRCTELYRGMCFERKALERSFSELLDELARDRPPRKHRPLIITTDEKIEYCRALVSHRLFREQDGEHRIAHRRVHSTLPRTFLNPLFASNYLDREIRKDQASLRRESTCFGRNVANGLSRMACYVSWHNYRKRFSIKAPIAEDQCHAEEAGVKKDLIRAVRSGMFRRRAFLSLTGLDPLERKIWMKLFQTPGTSSKPYLPAFAVG